MISHAPKFGPHISGINSKYCSVPRAKAKIIQEKLVEYSKIWFLFTNKPTTLCVHK